MKFFSWIEFLDQIEESKEGLNKTLITQKSEK